MLAPVHITKEQSTQNARYHVSEYPGARAAPPAGRGDPPDLCEGVCKKKQHRGARARGHGQPFARTGPRQQLGAP